MSINPKTSRDRQASLHYQGLRVSLKAHLGCSGISHENIAQRQIETASPKNSRARLSSRLSSTIHHLVRSDLIVNASSINQDGGIYTDGSSKFASDETGFCSIIGEPRGKPEEIQRPARSRPCGS